MVFTKLMHVGIVVRSLERSVPWWTEFLGVEPYRRREFDPSDRQNFVGRLLGYEDLRLAVALFHLPSGIDLEMIEYRNPPPRLVDMETYNVGNTHVCLETKDIHADYPRLAGRAQFRTSEPMLSVTPHGSVLVCFVRDPDGISIELVQNVAATSEGAS